MASKKASFQVNWLQEPQFAQWLEKVSDTNSAKCNMCRKTFSLSNMGRRAITSHMSSAKHAQHQKAVSSTASIRIFTSSGSTNNSGNKQTVNTVSNSMETTNVPQLPEKQIVVNPSQTTSVKVGNVTEPRGLKSLMLNDDVTKAEVYWCLQTVMTHKSMRTAGKDIQIMTLMLPDSDILKKIQLQKDKIGYTLAFGIAPFFKKDLITNLSKSEFITVGFDESLNKVSQKNQMDVNVRFWDNTANEVKCRYLTSVFLGRSTAQDLLLAYNEAIEPLNKKKIIQISMDGPNVNKKFLKDLKESMSEEPEDRTLLDIGSCGIHTMHCAFKGAMVSTGWNLVSFLRALYNLLKDCPARRAIYTKVTKSSLFPKKFCAVRWLENANVAVRALEMLPSIKCYVQEMKRTGEVSSISFNTIAHFSEDPFLPPKLEFFKSLACDLEPFLREFQSDQPLSPFLYDRLNAVIKTQMEKIVLPAVLDGKQVKDIELKKENLRPLKHFALGIGVKSALRSMDKQPDVKMLAFRQECRAGLVKFIEKMLERSPIKYRLTKFISCLAPKVAAETKVSHSRMENLLTTLLESKWINTVEADQAQRAFNSLTNEEETRKKLIQYKLSEERLDSFWADILKLHPENSISLAKVVKIVTTLAHGNANVERGFSVNKECITENMKEELLIAQRTVFDHVLSAGGVDKVTISKPLLCSTRNSYHIYKEHMAKKKIEMDEVAANRLKKRAAERELQELEGKKAKLLQDAQESAALIADKISKLKKITS